ncbi:MAG: DeoR/GlpR family DNA-binding transcription regulator [Anaerolineae bacterium]
MLDDSSLLAVERQRLIRDILEREGVVRNAELKELLKVSAVTIRSDLRELENAGICEVIWGGAVYKRPIPELEYVGRLTERSQLHPEPKRRIGARAAQLVEEGQTIIVDAGSTTVELIHSLPRNLEYLRIVTAALNIATAASQFPYVELVMTGGVLRHLTHSLIGPQVMRSLEMFNADWAFIASEGFDIARGLTASNLLEVEVKRAIIERTPRNVLMADSSKFGKILPLNVASMRQMHTLITDSDLSAEGIAALKQAEVEVLVV